jgi:hypothetical protein
MEFLLDKIRATKNNSEFFDSMRRGYSRLPVANVPNPDFLLDIRATNNSEFFDSMRAGSQTRN